MAKPWDRKEPFVELVIDKGVVISATVIKPDLRREMINFTEEEKAGSRDGKPSALQEARINAAIHRASSPLH